MLKGMKFGPISKTKLAFHKWLKRAIGLKTCFGGAFDKLLVFVDQKYHT